MGYHTYHAKENELTMDCIDKVKKYLYLKKFYKEEIERGTDKNKLEGIQCTIDILKNELERIDKHK